MAAIRQEQSYTVRERDAVLLFVPQNYQDVRDAIAQMQNRHLILLDIAKLSGQELRRCLDYLAGFSDCCNATLSKASDNLVMISPVTVPFTDLSDHYSFSL